MKLKTMLYGLTLMLGCFVLASCINDEEGPCLSDAQTKAVFSLVLQDNAQTRAAWSENSGAVSKGIDNYIDLSTLKMYVFKADDTNTYVGPLTDIMYIAQSKESAPYETNRYECIGTLPDVEKGSYRFVVLANCEDTDLPSQITWEGLKKIVLEKSGTAVNKIPMWGFLNADIELNPGQKLPLGELPLLRAMAKVTVMLTDNMVTKGFALKGITLDKYNTKGFVGPTEVLPSNAPDDAELNSTSAIDQEDCIHVYTADGYTPSTNLEFTVANQGIKNNAVEFYVPEYDNTEGDATITVVLSYTDPTTEVEETFTYSKGIKFMSYTSTGEPEATPVYYDIVRNHHYKFNIINAAIDGPLYVVPTVLPWNDGDKIEDYKIAVSTNMRLFDSWLYRYDTVDQDYTDWTNWAGSHMAVAPGLVTLGAPEEINKPLYSPQIQLVTTLPANTSEMTYGLKLKLDNDAFQFVQVNKTDNVISSYTTHDELTIANGTDVYTYFYIVPKSTTTPTNRVAKVTLVYNDPVVGEITVPFNYNALPGYSDDSSEIWAYYFPVDEYNITGKLKMYYQDAANPLVPTPVQN